MTCGNSKKRKSAVWKSGDRPWLRTLRGVFRDKVSRNVAHFIHDEGLSQNGTKRLIAILQSTGVDLSFQSLNELRSRLMESSIEFGLSHFITIDLTDTTETSQDSKYFTGPMLMAYRDIVELAKNQFQKRKEATEFSMSSSQGTFYSEIHTGMF